MSGFQGLTLSLQERHGELVGDVRMPLMGHVAEGFTDPEIRAMADFFAAIPAVEEGVRP